MNEKDKMLLAVRQEIEKIKQPTVPPTEESAPKPKETQTAGEMVEKAFTQAVVATVTNDEKVQTEILAGAEKVIQNKTEEIKARAEREAKEAHFNNKKSACECFGYNETTTEKWAVSLMGVWHNVVTAIWIVIGMFTFAPVTFVAKKLSVIIKTAWLAVLCAIIIYAAVALSPLWFKLLAQIRGGV
jgi:hypothetical protein